MNISRNEKYLCLLAPSFVSEFEYPNIVYRLRALGFSKVLELTYGAKIVNIAYYAFLKDSIEKGEEKTWIASPCPTLVNYIRAQYPHLVENLVPVHSPMGAMGLICKKFYPEYKTVFIGPCVTKKLEASEVENIDEVMTFKELEEFLKERNIPEEITESKYCESFDKFYNDYTKIYPISGGLSSSLHYKSILKKREVLVKEGVSNLKKVFEGFMDGKYKHYKFLDLLNCEGGCINGPGMIGERSVRERRKRILEYRKFAWKYEKDLGKNGNKSDVEGMDFGRKY
jgi:iron only hydrogenase large subunit-like protein